MVAAADERPAEVRQYIEDLEVGLMERLEALGARLEAIESKLGGIDARIRMARPSTSQNRRARALRSRRALPDGVVRPAPDLGPGSGTFLMRAWRRPHVGMPDPTLPPSTLLSDSEANERRPARWWPMRTLAPGLSGVAPHLPCHELPYVALKPCRHDATVGNPGVDGHDRGIPRRLVVVKHR